MTVRRPQDTLAGCCWLPRFADKVRLVLAGRLPALYRLALGSRLGIDGYFLRHFRLTYEEFTAAVAGTHTDDGLAEWFLARPTVTPDRIDAWNRAAPSFGAKGHQGYVTRHCVKWLLYPKSVSDPVTSLFEAIDQDESTGPYGRR